MRIRLLAFAAVFATSAALAADPLAATAGLRSSLCNGPHNGVLDGLEECETGACCTADCRLAAASFVCRHGDHPLCDPDETCDGVKNSVDAACPDDYLAPDETPCDDLSPCTDDDECDGGSCDGGVLVVRCEDSNPCTLDFCDPGTGECVFQPRESPCDDGLFCTADDHCADGACTGAARTCDDANACTDDSCNETSNACVNADNTAACDDGDECTLDDTCAGGTCGGIANPACEPTTTTTVEDCPACGDPNGDCKILAADALRVLKAAVGLEPCPLHACDGNGDGKVTATDALRVLRLAVGVPVTLACPDATTTTTTTSFSTTSTSSSSTTSTT